MVEKTLKNWSRSKEEEEREKGEGGGKRELVVGKGG